MVAKSAAKRADLPVRQTQYRQGLPPIPVDGLHLVRPSEALQVRGTLRGGARRGDVVLRDVALALRRVYPNAARSFGQSATGAEAPDVVGTPYWVECGKGRTVRFHNAAQGYEATGSQLLSPGVRVNLPELYSAEILYVDPVDGNP